MSSESKSSSPLTLQEMSLDQRRAFVEAITKQKWLQEWLIQVYEQPTQQHIVESYIPGWNGVVAFFDDHNQAAEAGSTPDQYETRFWKITLDRDKGQLVVEFTPKEYHPTITPSNIATLNDVILSYQDYPIWDVDEDDDED